MDTNKKIFLSGMPKSGKTSMLIKLVDELGRDRFFGFYTQEIIEDGQRKGFKIVFINNEKEFLLAHKEIKSNVRYGRYYIFIENINKAVDIFFNSIDSGKICIVDEIGPMELSSPKFQKIVDFILTSEDIYCISTVHRKLLNTVPYYFWVSRGNWWEIYNKLKRIVKNWIKQ